MTPTEIIDRVLLALLALTPLITWLLVSHRVSGSVSLTAKLEERNALVEARRAAAEWRAKAEPDQGATEVNSDDV